MRKLLRKEMTLSASVLTYLFLAFAFLFFMPGYPVLCGPFFVTLGIFQSFQGAAETNDILFSALLPVSKKDVVRAKYLFLCVIEGIAVLLMAAVVCVRMTVLRDAPAYRENALMNANGFALGMTFVVFGLFNTVFMGGYFRNGCRAVKPFFIYIAAVFPVIAAAEAVHYFPGLGAVNAFGTEYALLQAALLAGGAAVFALLTAVSCRVSCARFEKTDL